MTIILSRGDVEGLVPMGDVIDAVENAHADLSRQTAAQPAPTSLSLASGSAVFLPMSAMADRQGVAAVKFMADIPDNAARGMPVQRSTVLLLSQRTGECLAVIDGQTLTRQRTAAASAVASRHLARPESSVLGLVGAGNLAIEHVRALTAVLPVTRVLVWSRRAETVQRFRDRVAEFSAVEVEVAPSVEHTVRESDVLCTLTPSREPIVQGAWFRPGLHINAVGAPPRADHREIDSAGMGLASLFVDSLATSNLKSGDLLLARKDGYVPDDKPVVELGDVITGVADGRTGAEQITLFNSVGLALQDLAIGALMLAAAQAEGRGTVIDLSSAS
ncbi:ornithine cyclodeaminase family protein [Subtercola endophyticus]|uniref:ornithine cyclodeaminase family protein n=1 Tax=Subtercola endophyticus TaxID=2895559 RepID=UPI001E292FC8|nr:ornithine cyclodeaminase family protein [Subtercola endophyticus]UFS57920.1 ornithine cyclodeaminase family protein [Subtercola endophyticus]